VRLADEDIDETYLGRVSVETSEEESADEELIAASRAVDAQTRIRIAVVAVAIVIGVAIVAVQHSGLFRPLVLGLNDQLLLTVIQNKTADKNLDGTVMQGIEIALRQSRSLNVLGGEAYRAGGRLITLSSSGHRSRTSILTIQISNGRPMNPFVAYGRSKTATLTAS